MHIAYLQVQRTGARGGSPIFWFAGGPGESSISEAADVLGGPTRQLLEHHDFVFVDQRGSGLSNGLYCPPATHPRDYFGHVLPDTRRLIVCRKMLAQRADLRAYTTSASAEDIDAVRRILGYERITVWGGSYGTRAAMVYMRQHRERVEHAILDGVYPFDVRDPLMYASDAQRALDTAFAQCAADRACVARYPHLEENFLQVLTRLRDGPAVVSIMVDQVSQRVRYSVGDFGYTVRGMLYSVAQTDRLPNAIVAAAGDELSALAQTYYQRAVALDHGIAMGLYLSVMCTEEVPPFTAAEVAEWTRATFLGDYLIRDYQRACQLWPRGVVSADYHSPLHSDIPTLVFSGGHDPATPETLAARVAENLTGSLHVVFPHRGHGSSETACATGIIAQFLNGVVPANLDTSCARASGD